MYVLNPLEDFFVRKLIPTTIHLLTAYTSALLVFNAPSPAHTLHRLYLVPGPLCRGVCTWEGDRETAWACSILVCLLCSSSVCETGRCVWYSCSHGLLQPVPCPLYSPGRTYLLRLVCIHHDLLDSMYT